MARFFSALVAPLLPAIIPLILLVACAKTPAQEASQAYDAARNGDIEMARKDASRAYDQYENLPVEDLCRLAAAYAMIAITTGDDEAADRFQTVYKASMTIDPLAADSFYRSQDPQMADGLAIISGLLDGNGIYSDRAATADTTSEYADSIALLDTELYDAGMAED